MGMNAIAKTLLTAAALGLGSGAVLSTPAQAALKVCNQSGQELFVAVGYKDGDNWMAEGWWDIQDGDCTNVVNGDLNQRYYYLRGESTGSMMWTGNYEFCTTSARFVLAYSAHCESGTVDRKGFFEVDTGNSADWTTNLSRK